MHQHSAEFECLPDESPMAHSLIGGAPVSSDLISVVHVRTVLDQPVEPWLVKRHPLTELLVNVNEARSQESFEGLNALLCKPVRA